MSRERFIPHHSRPVYMDEYGRMTQDAFHFDALQSSLPVPLPRNGFVYAFAAPTVSNANNGRSPPVSPRSSEEARRSRRGQQGNDSPERDRKDRSSREGSRRSAKSEKSTASKDLVKAASTHDNAAREEWLLGARFSLEHLHDQLSAAHWMYKKAHDDFDNKITPDVREFVQKGTLGDMWADMLRTNARKEEDERKAAGKREKAPSFRSVRAQVKHGLTSLTNATCYEIPPTATSHDQDTVIKSHINGVIYAVEEALEFARDADEDHEACSKAIEKFIWARNLTKSNAHLWRDLDLPIVAGPEATADGGAGDDNKEHAQEEDTSNEQASNKDAQWQQTNSATDAPPKW
ncbi:hypothetical protein CGCF415_v001820 [Colletotrichum fructicola]|nr:hypothetical protein CGCF415_v001820 [Colletotrichum fructicola]KAF4934837.1 hypothetical protein CGCF245_v008176 [Colletotrichum fructicola]